MYQRRILDVGKLQDDLRIQFQFQEAASRRAECPPRAWQERQPSAPRREVRRNRPEFMSTWWHGLTKISHLYWGVSWWWWVIWGLLCQLKFYVYWLLGLGRRATLHQQQALTRKSLGQVFTKRLALKTWAERPTLPLDRCRKAHDLRCFGARHCGIVGPPSWIAKLASDNYGNDDPYNIL